MTKIRKLKVSCKFFARKKKCLNTGLKHIETPSINLSGIWLNECFQIGDEILISYSKNEISITKKHDKAKI